MLMTDARNSHATPLTRLKPLFAVCALCLLVTGCANQTPKKTYTLQIEDYQGFIATNDFLTRSPLSQLASLDEVRAYHASARDDVVSRNLFESSGKVRSKGNVYDDRLLSIAFTQLGARYRSGGDSPSSGFDCSGFTTWVFRKYGMELPRSSREQFQMGRAVAKNDLRKGDLVFFSSRRGINHVGIYLESGKFIHSASNGKNVIVSHLEEDYWRSHYAGGRRVF